jgi:hypothetical protein
MRVGGARYLEEGVGDARDVVLGGVAHGQQVAQQAHQLRHGALAKEGRERKGRKGGKAERGKGEASMGTGRGRGGGGEKAVLIQTLFEWSRSRTRGQQQQS